VVFFRVLAFFVPFFVALLATFLLVFFLATFFLATLAFDRTFFFAMLSPAMSAQLSLVNQ